MKFIHTADWQIGKIYEDSSLDSETSEQQIKDFINKRFQTIEKIKDEAVKQNVDFVLIAGDLFDKSYERLNDIDSQLIPRTIEILNSFDPISVFILPGNHDFSHTDSIWNKRAWLNKIDKHVTVFQEKEKEYDLNNNGLLLDIPTVIYPCPFFQRDPGNDLTEWIPKRDNDDHRFRIVLAHGSILLKLNPSAPINVENLSQLGLNYVALGDQHGYSFNKQILYNYIRYSGTPEQCRISEQDPGKIIIVEINSMETLPNIRSKNVFSLHWADLRNFDLSALTPGNLEYLLREEISNQTSKDVAPQDCLLKLSFKPVLLDETSHEVIKEELEEIVKKFRNEFLIFDYQEPQLIKKQPLDGFLLSIEEKLKEPKPKKIAKITGLSDQEIDISPEVLEHAIQKEHELYFNIQQE